MSDEISPDLQKVIDQVKKLLNLAAKNPNEHEAAAATAKAQELLTRYNLDVATVEKEANTDGKREQLKVDGGFYKYQRSLWEAVAQLNFCIYWTQQYATEAVRYVDDYGAATSRRREDTVRKRVRVLRYRHALVGRTVNTRTTVVMTQYLQQAIERVTRERLKGNDNTYALSTWAVSFRKGAAARIVEMIQDRREEMISAEEERKRKAARAGSGASTATGLTISVLVDQETDANMDFIHGEGYSVKKAAQRAARAAERKREMEEWTAWCAANPEEAAKRAQEQRKQEERNANRRKGYRYRSSRGDGTDMSAYYAGYDAAKDISINQQTDDRRAATPRIGR